MTDRECLEFIRERYGILLGLSAIAWGHRAEVLAGIMCRETRGGTSPLLDIPGPAGRGDGGHGHGLMQIDDRSFPDFCAGEKWKEPAGNIDFGARVLFEKKTYLSTKAAHHFFNPLELEQAGIAAYNCGQGNVLKALDAGLSMDHFTAHQDYSSKVLEYALLYASLVPTEHPVEPKPMTAVPKFNFLAFILKLFRR